MILEKIDFSKTQAFSSTFLDYIQQKEILAPFYHRFPSATALIQQAEEKQLDLSVRQTLSRVLSKQYQGLELRKEVSDNISSLKEPHTYTVTTGHQLNIFSGPLYFIYKIVTVIKACEELKAQAPDKHFVPVYWMASEDHDFAEINHFQLFGQTYRWESDQQGPVGRFALDGIKEVLAQLPESVEIFEKAYTECSNLADATRHFVNALFGQYGLLVLDADNSELKKIFLPVIQDELTMQSSAALSEQSSEKLEALGYKAQIYPREINLFYMQDGLRERIVKTVEGYEVLNTNITFTNESLLHESTLYPERFSPNVVLRPLYQEMILPNIAYVGGPAEVAYWLQLKSVFDHYQVSFPALMPRNFALIINKGLARKIEKLGLDSSDLFLAIHDLKKNYLMANAEGEISLKEEIDILEQVFESIRHKAMTVDKSLDGFIGAEASKTLKNLENIEKRLKKAEEKNQETAMTQIEQIKEKLFPGGGLQERKENMLNFYLNQPLLIEELMKHFSPFDYRFHVLKDHE